jgi:hypothetical protein
MKRLKQASWRFWANVVFAAINMIIYIWQAHIFSFWCAAFNTAAAIAMWKVDDILIRASKELNKDK